LYSGPFAISSLDFLLYRTLRRTEILKRIRFAKYGLVTSILCALASTPASSEWKYSEYSDGQLTSVETCSSNGGGHCAGLKCNAFAKPELYWFIDAPDRSSPVMSTISIWQIDGASFVLDMEKAGEPENGVQHYESRFDPETSDFIEAMKSGKTLTVRSDLIGTFPASLGQPGKGIADVIEGCVKRAAETGAGQAQSVEIAPPNEQDLGDIVRWVFETNKCVATETQLFDALYSRFGTSLANKTVIDVSNDADVTLVSRDPYTYRFAGSELCGGARKLSSDIDIRPITDNGWEPIRNKASGRGAAVCTNEEENFICFALRCRQGAPLEYTIFFSGGQFLEPVPAEIYVDDSFVEEIELSPVEPNSELRADFDPGSQTLSRLKDGRTMTFVMAGKGHRFSLRGSKRQIESAEEICPASARSGVGNSLNPAASADLESRVQSQISRVISEDCEGSGTFDERAIFRADFDADGTMDFAVDPAGITCSSGMLPLSCGAQVCASRIFLHANGDYKLALEMQNTIGEVVPGSPPGLRVFSHGGATGTIAWDGKGFSRR
jgi:hypothetical protein